MLSLRRFTSRIVDRLKEYRIVYRGLGEGKHTFNFILDRSFFDCFKATEGTEGKVEAQVEILKSALLMEVRIQLGGAVKAICDRCLEEMELKVEGELNLYVKQGTREDGNDDDFIVLSSEEDFLDLSSYLYEVYMLNYPIRVVHEPGGCNQDMEKVLGEYVKDEGEKPTDPRWDELKKLINN